MAFYSPFFSEPDHQHYYQTSYTDNYENSVYEAPPPVSYSSYGYQLDMYSPITYNHQTHQQWHDYDHHYSGYDFAGDTVEHSYSVSTNTYPNLIEFNPSSHSYSAIYSPAQTQFIISYSVSDFNEPVFEEYDPTPYGGGYDITKTYGKPLPPSEEICYPASTKEQPRSQSLDLLPLGPAKPPPEKEGVDGSAKKPQNGRGPVMVAEEEQKETSFTGHGGKTEEIHDKGGESDSGSDSDSDSESHEEYAVESVKQPDSGSESDERNRVTDSNAVDVVRQVPLVPPGYGLEAMDICESLFGYWPCLARYRRESNSCEGNGYGGGRCIHNHNQWQDTADYLFGGLNPYERRDLGDGFRDSLW